MASRSFRFQQFEVFHDRCGMKVGTDGVLLGAWVQPKDAGRILDVGTGSGLIALILAQHSPAEVVGVEFDREAALQAAENAGNSPWSNRIRMVQADFKAFQDQPFDLIVSNPPFFQKALRAPEASRNVARHDVNLSYAELVVHATALLTETGRLAVVLPAESATEFIQLCAAERLHLARRCDVSTLQGQPPKRVLLEFGREVVEAEHGTLAVGSKEKSRSEAYSDLTSDLYL
jgi:tRNA1Val (adenine37-N6)-methyltransferase